MASPWNLTFKASSVRAPELTNAFANAGDFANQLLANEARKEEQRRQASADERAEQQLGIQQQAAQRAQDEYADKLARTDAKTAQDVFTNELMMRARGIKTADDEKAFLNEMQGYGGYDAKSILSSLPKAEKGAKPTYDSYFVEGRGWMQLSPSDVNSLSLAGQKVVPMSTYNKGIDTKSTGTPSNKAGEKAEADAQAEIAKIEGLAGNPEAIKELIKEGRTAGASYNDIRNSLYSAGGSTKMESSGLFDWGKKDLDLSDAIARYKELNKSNTTPAKSDVPVTAMTTPKEAVAAVPTRSTLSAGQVGQIQNEIQSLSRGGILSTGKSTPEVRRIIDEKYGKGTYDRLSNKE